MIVLKVCYKKLPKVLLKRWMFFAEVVYIFEMFLCMVFLCVFILHFSLYFLFVFFCFILYFLKIFVIRF